MAKRMTPGMLPWGMRGSVEVAGHVALQSPTTYATPPAPLSRCRMLVHLWRVSSDLFYFTCASWENRELLNADHAIALLSTGITAVFRESGSEGSQQCSWFAAYLYRLVRNPDAGVLFRNG